MDSAEDDAPHDRAVPVVGRDLRAAQFPTAERRGRLHTDLARAYGQWGKPEQTAHALLDAHRAAPSEVRNRPSIRVIVTGFTQRRPHTSGVRELVAAAVRLSPATGQDVRKSFA